MDIITQNKIVDRQDEFDLTTSVVTKTFQLIQNYINKHGNIALACGAEWMYQDDEGQVDALELVGKILDNLSVFAEPEDED